ELGVRLVHHDRPLGRVKSDKVSFAPLPTEPHAVPTRHYLLVDHDSHAVIGVKMAIYLAHKAVRKVLPAPTNHAPHYRPAKVGDHVVAHHIQPDCLITLLLKHHQ